MDLTDYKKFVENKRMVSRIDAIITISNATKESENTKWVPMYQLNQYAVRLALA